MAEKFGQLERNIENNRNCECVKNEREFFSECVLPGASFTNGFNVLDESDLSSPRRRNTVPSNGEDDRIRLNVGGIRHETHVSTLRVIPNSRLSRLAEKHVLSRGGHQEYFFDRHPSVFNAIIDFYRTGELHVPLEVCSAVVKRELDFWQIDEMEIKACCWRHYRSYIENQAILDSFNNSLIRENMHVNLDNMTGWRKIQWRVWLVLEYPRTSRVAMMYGITSFLFVVTSIAGFCLETLPRMRPTFRNSTAICLENSEFSSNNSDNVSIDDTLKEQVMSPQRYLYWLDVICTVFFSLELVMRFLFAPNKWNFVVSLMNVIDLLALVPLYVTVILQSYSLQACYLNERFFIEVMFILRIIRMLRIFHLVKHYQALKVLVYALKASLHELLMLFIFLLIGMLIFSTMIYYAERKDANRPGDMFSTIPMGFWWAVITMTTVGYGDVYPSTTIGYVVGVACSVCGVLMVALTIPVISNNFTLFYRHVKSRSVTPRSKGGEADSNTDISKIMKCCNTQNMSSFCKESCPITEAIGSVGDHSSVLSNHLRNVSSCANVIRNTYESNVHLELSGIESATQFNNDLRFKTETFV